MNNNIRKIALETVSVVFPDDTRHIFKNVAEFSAHNGTIKMLVLDGGIDEITVERFKLYNRRPQKGYALVSGDNWHEI